MTSEQYEELCRRFIADKTGKSVDEIRSIHIPNPKRPGLPEYKHQIDLYWETGDEIALYLNIANAKWRTSAKVEQGEVLLLQQVRQKTGAHKAFMLTNIGFTAGALAAAHDDGIALHTISPALDVAALPMNDREAIQASLASVEDQAESSLFKHRVVNRGLDFTGGGGDGAATPTHRARPASPVNSTRVIKPSTTRSSSGGGNRSHGSGGASGGGSSRGGPRSGRGPFFKK